MSTEQNTVVICRQMRFCPTCETEILSRRARTKYCSRRCSKIGPLNPNWHGDSVGVEAGRQRAQSLYKILAPCHICSDEHTERHHKDGNTHNNSPENIEFLCRRCHMAEDGRLSQLRVISRDSCLIGLATATANRRARKHCKQGHEYTTENTAFTKEGYRVCKRCASIASAKWYRSLSLVQSANRTNAGKEESQGS